MPDARHQPWSPRRTRAFVIAFVVLAVALAVLAGVLINAGREDAEFQQELEQLREGGR